jgi:hypothetical protein
MPVPERKRRSTLTGPVAGSDSSIVQVREFVSAPAVPSAIRLPTRDNVATAQNPQYSALFAARMMRRWPEEAAKSV